MFFVFFDNLDIEMEDTGHKLIHVYILVYTQYRMDYIIWTLYIDTVV